MNDKVKRFKDGCDVVGIDTITMRRKIEERIRAIAKSDEDDFWALAYLIAPTLRISQRVVKEGKRNNKKKKRG